MDSSAASEQQMPGLGIPPGLLALVLLALVGLFVATTLLASFYHEEQAARATAHFQYGSRLAEKGRYEQAITHYREALSITRGTADFRLAIARALVKLDRLAEAQIYLHELLQSDPANAVPNLMLARISEKEGRSELAATYYRRAIYGFWPADAEQNRVTARFELVELLGRSGKHNQVAAELLEMVDQVRDDPALMKRIAGLLLKNGNPAQAGDIFRDSIKTVPNDAEAFAGLGEAEFVQGKYPEAESSFRRAVRLAPGSEANRARLALVTEIAQLDPTARRLSSAERYRRSKILLERSIESLRSCVGSPVPKDLQPLMDEAQAKIKARSARLLGDAAEENMAFAEQVWSARTEACPALPAEDEALSRILVRLSK